MSDERSKNETKNMKQHVQGETLIDLQEHNIGNTERSLINHDEGMYKEVHDSGQDEKKW